MKSESCLVVVVSHPNNKIVFILSLSARNTTITTTTTTTTTAITIMCISIKTHEQLVFEMNDDDDDGRLTNGMGWDRMEKMITSPTSLPKVTQT